MASLPPEATPLTARLSLRPGPVLDGLDVRRDADAAPLFALRLSLPETVEVVLAYTISNGSRKSATRKSRKPVTWLMRSSSPTSSCARPIRL